MRIRCHRRMLDRFRTPILIPFQFLYPFSIQNLFIFCFSNPDHKPIEDGDKGTEPKSNPKRVLFFSNREREWKFQDRRNTKKPRDANWKMGERFNQDRKSVSCAQAIERFGYGNVKKKSHSTWTLSLAGFEPSRFPFLKTFVKDSPSLSLRHHPTRSSEWNNHPFRFSNSSISDRKRKGTNGITLHRKGWRQPNQHPFLYHSMRRKDASQDSIFLLVSKRDALSFSLSKMHSYTSSYRSKATKGNVSTWLERIGWIASRRTWIRIRPRSRFISIDRSFYFSLRTSLRERHHASIDFVSSRNELCEALPFEIRNSSRKCTTCSFRKKRNTFGIRFRSSFTIAHLLNSCFTKKKKASIRNHLTIEAERDRSKRKKRTRDVSRVPIVVEVSFLVRLVRNEW